MPFTANRDFKAHPRLITGAKGVYFTTHDGRQVLDGISSLWCVGAGHNRREINEAIKQQLDTLDYATAFNVSNDKAFMAADKIAAMAPGVSAALITTVTGLLVAIPAMFGYNALVTTIRGRSSSDATLSASTVRESAVLPSDHFQNSVGAGSTAASTAAPRNPITIRR